MESVEESYTLQNDFFKKFQSSNQHVSHEEKIGVGVKYSVQLGLNHFSDNIKIFTSKTASQTSHYSIQVWLFTKFLNHLKKEGFNLSDVCRKCVKCSAVHVFFLQKACANCYTGDSLRFSRLCHTCLKFVSYSYLNKHNKSHEEEQDTMRVDNFKLDGDGNILKRKFSEMDKICFIENEDEFMEKNYVVPVFQKFSGAINTEDKTIYILNAHSHKKRKLNYRGVLSILNKNLNNENETPNLYNVQRKIENNLDWMFQIILDKYPTVKVNLKISIEDTVSQKELEIPFTYSLFLEKIDLVNEDQKKVVMEKNMKYVETFNDCVIGKCDTLSQWMFKMDFLIPHSGWEKARQKYKNLKSTSTIDKYVKNLRIKMSKSHYFVSKISEKTCLLMLNLKTMFDKLFSDIDYRKNIFKEIVNDFENSKKTENELQDLEVFYFFKNDSIVFKSAVTLTDDGTSNEKLDLFLASMKFDCKNRSQDSYIPIILGNKFCEYYSDFTKAFGVFQDKNSFSSCLSYIQNGFFHDSIEKEELKFIFDGVENTNINFSDIKKFKLFLTFSNRPDLKSNVAKTKEKVIISNLNILKELNHKLYLKDGKNEIKELRNLFLNRDVALQYIKKEYPSFFHIFRNLQTDSILDFSFIKLWVDYLHWSFSMTRQGINFFRNISDLVEYLVDNSNFKKRSNEQMEKLFVKDLNILKDINSNDFVDVRDDGPKKFFNTETVKTLENHFLELIKKLDNKKLSQIRGLNSSVEEVKHHVVTVLKCFELVSQKMKKLIEDFGKFEKKKKKEILELAKESDYVKIFMILCYFTNKTIPHYCVAEMFLFFELIQKFYLDSNHTPERINILLKYIGDYHSMRFVGKFSKKIHFTDLLTRKDVQNNTIFQCLIGMFEKLMCSINSEVFKIFLFGETKVKFTKMNQRDRSFFFPEFKNYSQSIINFKIIELSCKKQGTSLLVDYDKIRVKDEEYKKLEEFHNQNKDSFYFFHKIQKIRKKNQVKLIQEKENGKFKEDLNLYCLESYFYPYQRIHITKLWSLFVILQKKLGICNLPTGTGKTKIILCIIQLLFDNELSGNILIVSPKGVSFEWIEQYYDLCEGKNKDGTIRSIKKHKIVLIRSEGTQKIELLDKLLNEIESPSGKKFLWIIPISLIKTISKARNQELKKYSKIFNFIFDILLLEESQSFSKQEFEILLNIQKKQLIVNTATLFDNQISDLENISKICNLESGVTNEEKRLCDSFLSFNSVLRENDDDVKKFDEIMKKYHHIFSEYLIIDKRNRVEMELNKSGIISNKHVLLCKIDFFQAFFYELLKNIHFYLRGILEVQRNEKGKIINSSLLIIFEKESPVPVELQNNQITNTLINFLSFYEFITDISLGYYDRVLELFTKIKILMKEFMDKHIKNHIIGVFKKYNVDNFFTDDTSIKNFIATASKNFTNASNCLIKMILIHQVEFKHKIFIYSERIGRLKHVMWLIKTYNKENLKKNQIITNNIFNVHGDLSIHQRKSIIRDCSKENVKNSILFGSDVLNCGVNLNFCQCLINIDGFGFKFSKDFQIWGRIERISNLSNCYGYFISTKFEEFKYKLLLNMRKKRPDLIIRGHKLLIQEKFIKYAWDFFSSYENDEVTSFVMSSCLDHFLSAFKYNSLIEN